MSDLSTAAVPMMDWAALLPEMLRGVAKKLNDPADFVRLRSVCKHWRRSVALSDAPCFLPWLVCLLHRAGAGDANFCFYSVASRAERVVRVPELEGMLPKASAGGYLFAVGDAVGQEWALAAVLVNPLTGGRIDLPRLPWVHHDSKTFVMVNGQWSPSTSTIHRPSALYLRARIFLDGGRWSGDAMVICYTCTGFLAFCRPADDRWTSAQLPFVPMDIIYRHGKILIGHERAVHVLDAGEVAFVARRPLGCLREATYRFVELPGGELCVAEVKYGVSGICLPTHYVHRLDMECCPQPPRCAGVLSLHGASLFFGSREVELVACNDGCDSGNSFNYVVKIPGDGGTRSWVRRDKFKGGCDDEQRFSLDDVDSWFAPTLS